MDTHSMVEANLCKKVLNFRHLTGTKLYRSSWPKDLDIQGVKSLCSLGIRTIVDLRSSPEKEIFSEDWKTDTHLNHVYPTQDYFSIPKTRDQEAFPKSPRPEHVHYSCDMMGTSNNYYYELLKREGVLFIVGVIGLRLWDKMTGSQRCPKYVTDKCFNKRGLHCLYVDLVDFCPQQICKVLELFCDPEAVPALVVCNQGKDRTGVICALALHCIGWTQEDIIKDYSKSEKELCDSVRLKKYLERLNLKPEFGMSSPETMVELWDHLKNRYGSVDGYLDSIGFDKTKQERLRQNIRIDCN